MIRLLKMIYVLLCALAIGAGSCLHARADSHNPTDIYFNLAFENSRCFDRSYNNYSLFFKLQFFYSTLDGAGFFNNRMDLINFGLGYKESRKCATGNFELMKFHFAIPKNQIDSVEHNQFGHLNADILDIKYNDLYSKDINWLKIGYGYSIPFIANRNGDYLYSSFDLGIAMRSFRPGTDFFADNESAKNQFGATFSGGPAIKGAFGIFTLSAYYKASISTSGACVKSLNPGAALEIALPFNKQELEGYHFGDNKHISRRQRITLTAQFDRIELNAGSACRIANFFKLGLKYPICFYPE